MFSLAGNKLIPEMNLKHFGFTFVHVGHLLKIKNGYKNLKKQKIIGIFIEMN